MSKRYNDHKKTPKPKENQQGILKMYALSQKIEQRASGSEESTAEVMYLSMIISIYLVVQQRPQLEHSSLEFMVATPTIMLKLQALAYIVGNNWTNRPIWNYATETLTSGKGC